ncbi:hypothetical protein TRFO_09555 [Tritrichomonas foetus]|uniref:Uncharacterized protein n=1 Tax=Tritrichomonas foetus TaxID=1144522 RepID=A0A1J4JJ68_9EUKA|nr:hypothetical protein TRFO_09555 [Tritrichomonas foetus]|eukprot:OHS97276.1 hypothetical protein TRFO_09555 [Tritrichomonas foetus]
MDDPHFLTEGGTKRLKKALEASDDPLAFIESLQSCTNFDFAPYSPLFQLGDIAGFDPSRILEKFIVEQRDVLLNKIKCMSPMQVNNLFRILQPYTMIPAFHDVIKYVIDRCKKVPKNFIIPEDLKVELTPADRLRLFKDRPSDFEEWLPSVFEDAMCDFDDSDDFSYLKLFKVIAQYCFHYKELHKIVIKYCEAKFFEDYHPMYCVIRFRMALFNSPLAKIDPARPLSILVFEAIQGKPDFHLIIKAADICPGIAQIILSVPSFTMMYRMKSYILSFGVTRELKDKWTKYLNTGDDEAVEYMKNEPFFARVIALNAAQGIIMNENLYKTIEFCMPQIDVNFIMCRNYDPKNEFILVKWASLNGCCFIDYMTSCLARGASIPDIPVPPLNMHQQEIYEYIKSQLS